MLLVATQLPELNKLSDDAHTGWAIYFTLNEVAKALLAFYLIPWTWIRIGGLIWFATQAVDEATGQNIWENDSPLEYVAFILLASIAWMGHKLNEK